jgi:hypothetical protein
MREVGLCILGAVAIHRGGTFAGQHNQIYVEVRLLAVKYASNPHGVLASLHNQIYAGVGLCAVGASSYPRGVFAGLHNQMYAWSETACSRIC